MSTQVHPPAPHTSNTDSTSNGKVQAAAGHRAKVGGLHLPANQAVSIPSGLKHETLIIPSSSTPSFGGFFTIDIREKGILLNNVTLQFNLSAVTGSSLVGYFNPAWFFFTRIEIVQNGNVHDTIYGNQQFLMNQLLEWDEDRLACNNGAGNYASTAQRTSMSSQSTTNTFYANLKTYFDQDKVALLTESHNIQLRVYMDTLQNSFYVSSGTLTSCNINSVNAYCRVTRLDSDAHQTHLASQHQDPHHHIMHDLHYGTFTVPSGNLSSTIVLSPIVGNVTTLIFTIRANSVTNQAWVYSQLASFALLDSASTNIVGGQVLPASFCANMLNKEWCKSSYNTETSFGINDQKANVYMWSFSADPISALTHGQALTSRKFTGQEQLLLNFPSALAAQVSVDVYAMVESILEVTPSSVRKIGM